MRPIPCDIGNIPKRKRKRNFQILEFFGVLLTSVAAETVLFPGLACRRAVRKNKRCAVVVHSPPFRGFRPTGFKHYSIFKVHRETRPRWKWVESCPARFRPCALLRIVVPGLRPGCPLCCVSSCWEMLLTDPPSPPWEWVPAIGSRLSPFALWPYYSI